MGEEPGWRGYAQRVLGAKWGWIRAALVIAAVWTLWHAPLWGSEFEWRLVPIWAVSVVGAALVLAWLYRASGESVLLCMLMHASVNMVGPGWVFKWFAPEYQTAPWVALARGVVGGETAARAAAEGPRHREPAVLKRAGRPGGRPIESTKTRGCPQDGQTRHRRGQPAPADGR
ncbi:MAG: CPBP family intramembrane metalloprotease [Gammaproteobacteria bacterium]|nr:CPBP family intramembrane metalloprotease [Gammaproteobacteria bacterium]